VACQIALGWWYPGPTSLILGSIGGYFLGVLVGASQCLRALSSSLARVRSAGLRRVAAEYRSFALITAPSNVINALGSQLPSMMLPSLFSLAVNGQYSFAQRVLSQPMVFIGQAVNLVFWGNAVRLATEEPARLWTLFVRVNACLLIAMAPALVLVWFGEAIFVFIFGAAWEQAGRFAGVMFVASFLGLAAQSTTSLTSYRLNHWMCAWEMTQFVLVACTLGAASWMAWSPMTCVVAITTALASSHMMLLGLNAVAIKRLRRRAQRTAAFFDARDTGRRVSVR
jgi:O-antigen/teichoic acid export membrane protein